MPPQVRRSSSYDAVVAEAAQALGGEWSAEPLEAALADIRRQRPEQGGSFGWSTFHQPGYRITFRAIAADADEARDVAATMSLPDGWRVDPGIDVRPVREPLLPP
jgi:hypothetical protein